MPTPTHAELNNPRRITCLSADSRSDVRKTWRLGADGNPECTTSSDVFLWRASSCDASNINDLYTSLSTLSRTHSSCVIRGTMAGTTNLGEAVTRVTRGADPTVVSTPRCWVSVDIDKTPGTVDEVMDRFFTAYPMFEGVSHIVQRTASYGMTPGKTSIRLWFCTNMEASDQYWRSVFETPPSNLIIDERMYFPGQLQFTASPVFLNNIVDPCADRWVLVPGLYDEVNLDGTSVEARLAVSVRASAALVTPPTVPNAAQLARTLDRLSVQVARTSTGHHHAFAIGCELYGIGCPPELALPVMMAAIPRAHGRIPRVGECEQMWEDITERGTVYTNNPPFALLFPDDVPDVPALPANVAATEAVLEDNTLGEWGRDAHVNAQRYESMFLPKMIHWGERDYELKPGGYWQKTEHEGVLALRISRDTSMARVNCTNTAFAIRSRNLKEHLDPPCRIDTKARLTGLLLLKNGFLRLDEIIAGRPVLHPHDDNHFTESVIQASYNPASRCPRFDQFLHELFPGDLEAQTQVLRLMAYLMVVDISFQKFFMLVGLPGSGKGTLVDFITHFMGESSVASISDMNTLLEPFGLAPLLGKQVAFLPEANQIGGRSGAEIANVIKIISGGDPVTVNRKNQPQLYVRLPTRLVSICNTPPELGDESGGLARRLIVLKFSQEFTGAPDRYLPAKLAAEKDGVLQRLLAELPGLYGSGADSGFYTVDSARSARDAILTCAAPASSFANDCVCVSEGGTLLISDITKVAVQWCAENNIRPLSSIVLARTIIGRFNANRVQTAQGRGLRGVALTEEGARLQTLSNHF